MKKLAIITIFTIILSGNVFAETLKCVKSYTFEYSSQASFVKKILKQIDKVEEGSELEFNYKKMETTNCPERILVNEEYKNRGKVYTRTRALYFDYATQQLCKYVALTRTSKGNSNVRYCAVYTAGGPF